jgi:hypothetical protein
MKVLIKNIKNSYFKLDFSKLNLLKSSHKWLKRIIPSLDLWFFKIPIMSDVGYILIFQDRFN